MEAIWETIKKSYARRYEDVRDWKNAENGKVIGCLPMYFPEEFVHAGGMLPVTLFGGDDPITLADRHLMTNACGAVRGTFESLLAGRYDFIDGIGVLLVCDQIRFFTEVWRLDHEIPFFHQMWRPYSIDVDSLPFLVTELERLRYALEKFGGKKISDTLLSESFILFNETRRLMRQLYELRRKCPNLISASDLIKAISAAMVMPKEKYNQMVKNFLELAKTKELVSINKPKLIVAGHLCAVPDLRLIDLIEELGAVITDDDFFSGTRYFETDIELGGDPLEAYASYCMNAVPCTTHHNPENWVGERKSYSSYGDWIVKMVKSNGSQGVILLQEMYCDPFDLEFVMVKNKLEDMNIPYLCLSTESGIGSLEPQRTRVQGFLEMINS